MTKGIIRICYNKTIDSTPSSLWEKYVFEDTYKEFIMQAQQFDQQRKYKTFQEILKNVPHAEQMHYLVSTAAIGYIRQLNERVPNVVNTQGNLCLPFKNFKFEIIQSHIENKNLHRIAIYFYSEPLVWVDTIDQYLVVAMAEKLNDLNEGKEVETETFALRPNLSISSFQKINFSTL
jgi:hypothetical protein